MNHFTKHLSIHALLAVVTFIALNPVHTGFFLVLLSLITIAICYQHKANSIHVGFIFLVTVFFIYFGLSPALACALYVILISGLLSLKNTRVSIPTWVACIALVQIPPVTTLALMIAHAGPTWSGLVVLPFFFIALATIGGNIHYKTSFLVLIATLITVLMGLYFEWAPAYLAFIAPFYAAASLLIKCKENVKKSSFKLSVVLVFSLIFSIFCIYPASTTLHNTVIWLPTDKTLSSKYFDSYQSVLNVTGMRAIQVISDPNQIKQGDLVIFPHAAHPEFTNQLKELSLLKHYSSLRILVMGEHTNADGVADALLQANPNIALNNNTSIPPKNSDFLGWSGSIGFYALPTTALNRGASVIHRSFLSVPLILIFGGHLEENLSDDGRLGDYQFTRNERIGLYSAMSMAKGINGPTWIIVGDSSPSLNEVLIASPREWSRLLALSTGIPAIFGLALWSIFWSASLIIGHRRFAIVSYGVVITCFFLTMLAIHLQDFFYSPQNSQIELENREVFGQSSVGKALVQLSKDLDETEVSIEVGKISSPNERLLVSIAHPSNWGEQRYCSRGGGIQVDKIKLMDVVTCTNIKQNAVLSLGDDKVSYSDKGHLVILDQHFISNAAPTENIDWLREQIKIRKNENK